MSKKSIWIILYIFILLVFLSLPYWLYLLISKITLDINIPSTDNISGWLITIPLVALGIWLLIKYWSSIFRNNVSGATIAKKASEWWKNFKLPKWVKNLFWIVLVFLVFWFGIGYLRGIKSLSKSNDTNSESYHNNSGVSIKNYPNLNMNGQNVMKAGEFKKFTIEYDGPTISWDIAGNDTVSLHFEKSEDKTRNWNLKIWRNKKDIKQYKFYPYKPPILAALVGTVYIKTEKDAIVIVSTN
jgi:hypothetical protein